MDQNINECDEYPDTHPCTECRGMGVSIGILGETQWFRCRACGMDFSSTEAAAPPPPKSVVRACSSCGHRCPEEDMCDKCGGDPMVPGDTKCIDCDSVKP